MSDQDGTQTARPPENTPGTVAAVVAVVAMFVVLFVRTGGGIGGVLAIVLSFFGLARAVRVDHGLGRSTFALAAGLVVIIYAVLA